jgi:hypothetical protein
MKHQEKEGALSVIHTLSHSGVASLVALRLVEDAIGHVQSRLINAGAIGSGTEIAAVLIAAAEVLNVSALGPDVPYASLVATLRRHVTLHAVPSENRDKDREQ